MKRRTKAVSCDIYNPIISSISDVCTLSVRVYYVLEVGNVS